MLGRGYTAEDHREGWKYLHTCAGFIEEADELTEEPSIREAIEELDAWDEPAFRIVRATLERGFPEQEAFVMNGLKPATGAAAVLSVERLLDRLDALERSPERKEDEAALATLCQRGIDDAKRRRMRERVSTAKSVVPPRPGRCSGRRAGRRKLASVRLESVRRMTKPRLASPARRGAHALRRDLRWRRGLPQNKARDGVLDRQSAASIARATSSASGTVRGEKRFTTLPSRPTRNFSKFQAMSAPPPASLPIKNW